MSGRMIFDNEGSTTTSKPVPTFPWVRFDANKFIYEEALIDEEYLGLHYSAMGRANSREQGYDKYKQANKKYDKNHLPSFELAVDGQLLIECWKWVEVQSSKTLRGFDEFVIILLCTMKKLRLEIHTLLDGSSFITRWLNIINIGDEPFSLSSVFPWCGIVFNEDDLSIATFEEYGFTLGRYKNMNWCMEGEFIWEKIPECSIKLENNKINPFDPSFCVVRNNDSAEMLVIDFEYSGGTCLEFSNCNYDSGRLNKPWRGSYLYVKAGIAGNPPYYVLEPGQSVSTPAVHLSLLYGNLDICTNELHGHLRKMSITKSEHHLYNPVEYNYAGYSLCVPATKQMILKEIDMASEIGAELFVVDAGWFGAEKHYTQVFGDWYENTLLDGQLATCFDYARQKGMMCGLWVAIEIMGPESMIYKEHPEWCLNDGHREVLMLDILQPEVEQYIFETIVVLIEKYKLNCFRIDGGPEQFCSWTKQNGKYLENVVWKYYDKLYDLLDRIHNRYPDLYLENCWGGGGRIGLGMTKHMHWTQITDNWHPEEQLRILNGLTFAVPPEQCQTFTGAINMNPVDIDFSVRVGLFSQYCIVGLYPSPEKYNEESFKRWQHAVRLYKDEIRSILPKCKVYHHTPDQNYSQKGDWVVLEYAGDNMNKAVVGIFRLGNSKSSNYLFVSQGLNPSNNYSLWLDNFEREVIISGAQLCLSGININIPGNMMSELLIIKVV